MDPNLLFWSFALIDLGSVSVIALFGVGYARSGEIARHKRAMKIASLLVLVFLGSYLLKLQFLGREDMSVWRTSDVWVLRVHEIFVFQMLIAGSVAWFQSRKLIATQMEYEGARG